MIIENLSTLKIHKLTQEQYDRELAAGNLDPNAMYLTPNEEIDLTSYATIEQLNTKADAEHVHNDVYYTETEIDAKLSTMQSDIDSKVDVVDGKGLSTNDYTTAEKDKLATVEANANFYEHPVHTAHSSGLYKITVDGAGHISGATLAAKEDIVALGVPAQDTTYDTEISDLSGRIDGVENGLNTTNQTLNNVSQELENYKTTNNEAVSTNATNIETNKTAIKAIKDDYLTSADKTQLQDSITQVSNKATVNASAIEVLNGDGIGSVKQSIDNAFNEFAANVTNDDVVNTYKELIDYAATHNSEFVTLVGKVDNIKTDVNEIETDLSSYKTTVSDQFTEVNTTIDNKASYADVDTAKAEAKAYTDASIRKTAPRNLLDNSDFRNPVNQRNAGTVTTKGSYPIDRWVFTYDGTTSIGECFYDSTAKCIRLKHTDNTSTNLAQFRQKIPVNSIFAGTYTVAIHTKTNTPVTSLIYANNDIHKSVTNKVPDSNGIVLYTFSLDATPTNCHLYIYAGQGKELLIDWVAVYDGEYTSETLPEYHPKGYGIELAECQRYYLPMNTPSQMVGYGYVVSTTSARIIINTPVTMRVAPSIYGTPSFMYRGGSKNGSLTYTTPTTLLTNAIRIDATGTDLPLNETITVYSNTSFGLTVDL